MTTIQKIVTRLTAMPDSTQHEVLDFVEFLEKRQSHVILIEDDLAWTQYSLSAALRGMEKEDMPYSISDIKETFS